MASVDQGASQRRAVGTSTTRIGEVSSLSPKGSASESQFSCSAGNYVVKDRGVAHLSRGAQSLRSKLGVSTIIANSNEGVYLDRKMAAPTQLVGSGGGVTLVTYYKLRARDSGAGPIAYVEWVTTTTPLSTASYTGALPNGGPLVELTVLSIRTN